MKPFALTLLLVSVGSAQFLDILWQRQGREQNIQYSHVFPLGDQNGDGYADWGVGASSPFDHSLSYIELFHGGNPPLQDPYRTIETIEDSMEWVFRPVSLGDVNGDGIIDFAFEYLASSGDNLYAIYFGGENMGDAPNLLLNHGPSFYDRELAGIGDFNGDGYDDVLDKSYEPNLEGLHKIYFGGNDFDLEPDWEVHNTIGSNSHLPDSWADLNADGFTDLLCFQNHRGLLRVFWGSASPDTMLDTLAPQPCGHGTLIPDVTGDGAAEIVSDCIYDPWERRHRIDAWFGGDTMSVNPDVNLLTLNNAGAGDFCGISDYNNDGFNDFIAYNEGENWFSLYLGYYWLNSTPAAYCWYGLMGPRYATALGDVNGDDASDFIVGGVLGRGVAIVFAGDPSYVVQTQETPPAVAYEATLRVFPNPFNSTLAILLSVPLHQEVTVTLYDLLGREVDVIHRGKLMDSQLAYTAPPGLASGIYFLRAETAARAVVQQVMLLK